MELAKVVSANDIAWFPPMNQALKTNLPYEQNFLLDTVSTGKNVAQQSAAKEMRPDRIDV